jgi:hypothetical protein
MNWKAWIYSIAAAAIGGASSSALSALVMPDVFNLTHVGLVHLGKAALIGALVPILTLLKASPLPAIQTTTETTTLTKTKVVDPAPPKPPEAA